MLFRGIVNRWNRSRKKKGHKRVRKIDFTVNLIYLLFSSYPVSRECIKPAHKEVLSFCLFRSTPSKNCYAPTGNNRINISVCIQKIFDNPETAGAEFNGGETLQKRKKQGTDLITKDYNFCLSDDGQERHNMQTSIWKCGLVLWFEHHRFMFVW